MNTRSLALASLALASVISACSDDDGGSASESVDTTNVSAFCRATAQISCSTMYSCLTAAEREAKNLPPTIAECQRKLESSCEGVVDTCDDGTFAYSPRLAADCLDEMQVATCNDAAEPWLDAPSCHTVCHRVAGSLKIAWRFSPAYACSDLGVEYVDVVSVGATSYTDRFYCFDGSGVTEEMAYGDYDIHVELYDASGARRWTSPAVARTTLDTALVDAGTITIPVQ